MRRRALACALLVVLAPACRKKKHEPRVVSGDGAILPQITYPGAGATRATTQTLAVGGRTRKLVVVAPVTPREALPVVLVLHGDGGDAEGFHRQWPFEKVTGEGAYLLYLDGIGTTWDLETTDDNREVAFARAAVDELAKHASIDRARVFAAGYSSGGFLANVIACQAPGFLRAISSSAGGAPYHQKEKWPNGFPKCPGQVPVATIALHGTSDWSVTLASGRFSAQYWASVNGCSDAEMETTGYAACTAYRGCPSGKDVVWCEVDGLNHWVWDHAAEASWTFFQRAR